MNEEAGIPIAGDDSGTEDEDAPNIQVKSWNFPKLHLRQHLFDDIVNKGVARNFSTKPNERMHGPIRKSYLRRTNFKNFGDQVSNLLLLQSEV